MHRSRTFAAPLVAAALAGALLLMFRAPEPPRAPVRPEEPAAAPSPAAAPVAGPATSPAPPPAAGDAGVAAPVDAPPAAAPASGLIRGCVVRAASGEPVAGAAVHVAEEAHAAFLEASGDRGPPSATADAEGRFALPGLRPGRYTVLAAAEGLAPALAAGLAVGADAGPDEVLLALAEGGAVAGVVFGEDERPLEGARVVVSRLVPGVEAVGDAGLAVESGEGGAYRADHLAPGRYRVRLARGDALSCERTASPGAPEGEDGSGVVTVVEGEAAYIDLWQSEFGAVAGKVLDPEGRPLRLVVNLFADGSGESMPRVAEPDAEGAYSFRGLAPGRYALVLAGLREEFGLERGERRREDLVVAVGRIEGVVEDGAGRPAGGVAVNYDRLGFADDGWLTGCPEPVRTDAFGRFALTGLCPGRYRLSAEAGEGEGASEVLDLRPGGEVRGVRVVLSPLATLAVLVVGGDGTPRPGAWVAWSQDAAHGGGACDGRGIARFSVRPGRVVLEVRAAEGEDRPATRVEADATAPEGPLVRVLVD